MTGIDAPRYMREPLRADDDVRSLRQRAGRTGLTGRDSHPSILFIMARLVGPSNQRLKYETIVRPSPPSGVTASTCSSTVPFSWRTSNVRRVQPSSFVGSS
jgi:hypothetical protein